MYFTETDPDKQLVRDAAANVMYDQARAAQQQLKEHS